MLQKSELFARLAVGHAARITVVTPNQRLAHSLTLEFDDYQLARGLTSWEAADILPFGAFVERLWEDALYSDLGEKLPLLLTPAQEQHLWERILAASGLLIVPQAAAQCRDAWRLIHQWRIGTGPGNDDALAYGQWSSAYKKQTDGDIDAARLPDLMAGYLDQLKKPALIVAYAFDVMPPQTRESLSHFQWVECAPDPITGTAVRAAFPTAKHELEAAAKWARARLEEGKQRIGVVVPELGQRRQEVVRIFSRVMDPGYNLPTHLANAAKAPLPFNVSIGRPLAAYPLVDAALTLIELAFTPIDFARASHLIRSPYIGGADTELARRASLDVRIRRDADSTIGLAKLIAAAEPAPLLRKLLERVFDITKTKVDSPADWARQFSALLEAAGFPGERTLDSDEFQTRAKWHEMLGELAKLERISSQMAFPAAFATLKRLCADTLFQPESPDAPIQILGVIESQEQRFDCLWVSGLTDDVWPRDARPNPFIPIALQKKAGIPQASAEGAAARDGRITEEWKSAAGEVVFSHATKDEDRDLAPSPLIKEIPEGAIAVPDYPRYRDLIFAARKMESFEDHRAPRVKPGAQRGGTRVLADQAACPFRAFARWRLGAEALEEPAPGLDPRDRGKLLHALMREIWKRVRSHANLGKDLSSVIAQAAQTAVSEMGLTGRYAELERERLGRLAREWLEVEARRAPFEVHSLEEEREISVAGMQFKSRIDRMDRLERGGHVLIDYKTGMPNPRHWQGPRPDDPQLPLYAVAAPEELAAIVFAKLRTGEMKFMGYSRAEQLLPNVQIYRDWPQLLAQWKADAEALGSAFAAGDAHVDPKEDLKTCRRCDLQTLCRVYEKFSGLANE
ncbi:MAG: PD-(D/E)XK nuclease family protein [Betaproteobacteria bacterium]|nr:MAG: PD-(D/E)XK nuclease family protein [Betaproteobacteria bacterium]